MFWVINHKKVPELPNIANGNNVFKCDNNVFKKSHNAELRAIQCELELVVCVVKFVMANRLTREKLMNFYHTPCQHLAKKAGSFLQAKEDAACNTNQWWGISMTRLSRLPVASKSTKGHWRWKKCLLTKIKKTIDWNNDLHRCIKKTVSEKIILIESSSYSCDKDFSKF